MIKTQALSRLSQHVASYTISPEKIRLIQDTISRCLEKTCLDNNLTMETTLVKRSSGRFTLSVTFSHKP